MAINPLGTVPLLLDGDIRMTESAAIAQYLVTRYGPTPLAVGVEEPDYGAFLNWLHFGEATLTFPQTLVLRIPQHQRLRERQRCFAEMQPVQERAVIRLIEVDRKRRRTVTRHQILSDRRRFRHAGIAVEQQRNG